MTWVCVVGWVGVMTFFAITRQDFVDTQMTRIQVSQSRICDFINGSPSRTVWYSALTELGVFVKLLSQSRLKKINRKVALCKTHGTKHDCFNGCGAATLWKLAWRRHKSFSPNWGWLALGKYKSKKELVSGFGKKDLCVVKHGITGRFAIACASWSQGPGHGVDLLVSGWVV